MHPEHLKRRAAVEPAAPAGDAVTAIQIGLDCATVAHLETAGRIARIEDLDAEFVAQHPGIGEKRLTAREGMEVGSADADAMDAHQRRVRFRGWFRSVDRNQPTGLLKDNMQHGAAIFGLPTGLAIADLHGPVPNELDFGRDGSR